MTITLQTTHELAGNERAQPRMSHRDYQSFWTTEERPGWLDRVLDQASSWLRDRLDLDFDVLVDSDVYSADRTKRAQTLHRTASRDRGARLRVWNTNSGGTFIVTVLAVETLRGGWLQITVTCDDPSKISKKPALADQFLKVVEFEDVTPLRAEAKHASVAGLSDIEFLINAPARRLPVIVAAPIHGVSFDAWNAHVNKWTQPAIGIAHVVSLDPHAAKEFENRHGTHAVHPGTLRTYPSGADLADPLTAKTARWISHQSLAGSDRAVKQMIESFVRQHAVSQPLPLPSTARDWSRAFSRIASGKLREAVNPITPSLPERREIIASRRRELAEAQPALFGPDHSRSDTAPTAPATGEQRILPASPSPDAGRLQTELAASKTELAALENTLRFVQDTLMLEDLSEASLSELLDAATRSIPDQSAIDAVLETSENLQSRIEVLEDDFLNEQIEKFDVRKELGRLEADYARATRELAYLRTKVAETDPEAAYSFTVQDAPQNPLGECPATWHQLAENAELIKHGIVFTANVKKIKEIANFDADGSALDAAWDALGTLAAYRTAVLDDVWDRDVHDFCDSGPLDRFHVPPNKHSRGETSATKHDNRFKKARLLPVPESVDKAGQVHMWAHFKSYSWAAEKKLRIHYYDQVSTDGSIYVGHVGEHLPSASTTKVHR